jgi:hypothetical protein
MQSSMALLCVIASLHACIETAHRRSKAVLGWGLANGVAERRAGAMHSHRHKTASGAACCYQSITQKSCLCRAVGRRKAAGAAILIHR